MEIPKSVKIGRKKWHVSTAPIQGIVRGKCYPSVALIEVRTSDPYVFWHELTHAILHDMGDPLWQDEGFVRAFSKRLDQAIKTARF